MTTYAIHAIYPLPKGVPTMPTDAPARCIEQLIDVIESQGRLLTKEEKGMLMHLSPAGIAKVNCDLCRPISMEDTLKDLQVAFNRHMECR